MGEEYENQWKKLLQDMQEEVKKEVENAKIELENGLKTYVEQEVKKRVQEETKQVNNNLRVCQLQLGEVTSIMIRQDHILKEVSDEMELVRSKVDRDILKIQGLEEEEEEKDPAKTVSEFFKSKLGITKDIDIADAFLVGDKSRGHRLMIVTLRNHRDKGLIFANTSKLKDVVNNQDVPYFVSDQLTAKKEAERRRRRQIVKINQKKSTAAQLEISFEKRRLKVEGREYQKGIVNPSCRDLLKPTKEVRMQRLQTKVKRGKPVEILNQTFIGYTAEVKSLQEVNTVYAKIKAMHLEARHVVAACKIPHREFHTHEDFLDDDEHGGGAFLLSLLDVSDIRNCAVFVVRLYDGTHIGTKRYDAMRKAVHSAIEAAGVNEITGQVDFLWQRPIRGRGQGGGRQS